MKAILKQLVPPILLPPTKALLKCLRRRPRSASLDAIERLKSAFEERNANTQEDQIALRPNLVLRLHPNSREPFEFFCYRSPEMVEEMDSFIRLTKDKRCLLDIGALHGVFSLVFCAASSSCKAIAVDASPVAFAHLLYNVHRNQPCNVKPIECALSDESGVLQMHYEWEHAVAAGTNEGNGCRLMVAKRTGDDLCAELRFEPDVIKIDVEGHEVKVVRGLQKTLQSTRPTVFLELHPTRIIQEQDTIDDLLKIFAELRYRIVSTIGAIVSPREVATSSRDILRLVFTPMDAA